MFPQTYFATYCFSRNLKSSQNILKGNNHLLGYVNVCQDMSTSAEICQRLSRHVNICRDMSTFVETCQRLPRHADICLDMSTFADICRHLSRYGFITICNIKWKQFETFSKT